MADIQLGTVLGAGNTASRPAAGKAGAVYIDTQATKIYRDNGSAWVAVTLAQSEIVGLAAALASLTTALATKLTASQAAHVADGSTVDQLRNALIAAGIMAAS